MDIGKRGDPFDPAGAVLGKYRIVRQLGEGAFGSVYEAVLPGPMGFTKRVAIKKLRASLRASPQIRWREPVPPPPGAFSIQIERPDHA